MISKETREKYLPTIGIECHVQLATQTKMFSSVDNDARDAEPNSKISAGDYSLPGTLPYLNHEAVRLAARAAKALNSEVAQTSSFDRKHYFYPDLPRGYQVTQMFAPIILAGHIDLPIDNSSLRSASSTDALLPQRMSNTSRSATPVSSHSIKDELSKGARVRIHHAHLEEDAGKLTHHGNYSLVDINRGGTPLIEIVSEPDMHSAAAAKAYAQELWLLMTYAGVSFGNMYYGNMRFDVNISVAPVGSKTLGTRIEIKNLNSFKMVERAVEHEVDRQIEMVEKGEKFVQATRGWDDVKGKTVPQREKENAMDYRYMPDPNSPPIVLDEAEILAMQEDMPMLPPEYRAKFAPLEVDGSVINALLMDQKVAALVAEVVDVSEVDVARRVANWFASSAVTGHSGLGPESSKNNASKTREQSDWTPDQVRGDNARLPSAENLIKLSEMTGEGKLSSTAAKEIFAELLKSDDDPEKIAESKNLLQVSDEGAISKIVDEVLASDEAAKAVADIKNGEMKAIGFLVGLVMKASKGQANPGLVQKLIREKTSSQ